MTETTETTNVTEFPPAKQRKLHIPFVKKSETVPTDATETPKRKHRAPHGAYTAGLLLVTAGVVAAAVSKLGNKAGDEASDVPSDTDTTDN